MSTSVHQLPRGRHRLTRGEVLASQRERMLEAIAYATAEKGFARATVADVIARAGVSRETFYEQFSDKEDCFLNMLDARVELLLEILGDTGAAPAKSPIERLDQVLEAYLEALAAEPTFAHAYLIAAYGAGPRAIHRRVELQRRFVEVLARVFGVPADRPSDDLFACEALVAAISALVTARVGEGKSAGLPQLREPILALVTRMFPAAAQPVRTRTRSAR